MITIRMQMQAVADLLSGQETDLPLDDFADDWRDAYERALQVWEDGGDRSEQLNALALKLDREPWRAIIEMAEHPLEFSSLDEIAPDLPTIEWLWQDWIPLGMLSLLGGISGAGKSFLVEELCRRVLAAEPFPDGSPSVSPGATVIYVDGEAVPQLLNERADMWRMDKTRFYLLLPEMAGADQLMVDFTHPAYRDLLVEMTWRVNPRLIVVDSLGSVSTKGENNIEDVRSLLAFLNSVAREVQCGMVLVHHLRKPPANAPVANLVSIHDFAGSRHIAAMARSVLGLSLVQTGAEPDPNGPRRLEVVKTNLVRYPQPLGVEFVTRGDAVWLRYGEAPEPYREPTKGDDCADWLLGILEDAGKPMKPKDIIKMGRALGYSRMTIYRARDALADQIGNTEDPRSPHNRWELIGDAD